MHPHVVSCAFSWCCASESERRAGLSVTGWRSRESLSAARRGETDMASVRKSNSVASRDIPFNKLVLSQSNVRRVKAGVSIEQLAERHRPAPLAAEPQRSAGRRCGRPGDRHVRGARRRTPLPRARTAGQAEAHGEDATGPLRRARATAASPRTIPSPRMYERVGLHPLDQFRAFRRCATGAERRGDRRPLLRHAGDRQAAAASGVGLAEAARRLCRGWHDARAAHGLHRHRRPCAAGAGLGGVQQVLQQGAVSDPAACSPKDAVRASDTRAQFVGSKPTKRLAASSLRDLFDARRRRLAAGRRRCSTVWSPRSSRPKPRTIARRRLEVDRRRRRLPLRPHQRLAASSTAKPLDLTRRGAGDPRRAATPRMPARERSMQDADELPERSISGSARSKRRSRRSRTGPPIYDPAEIARAGVFVSIDADGTLAVERGYVRPEDEAPHRSARSRDGARRPTQGPADGPTTDGSVQRTVITIGGAPAEDDEDEDDARQAAAGSARQRADRTSHAGAAGCAWRTIRMSPSRRCCTSSASTRSSTASSGSCLEASVRHVYLPVQAPDLKDSAVGERDRDATGGLEGRPAEGRRPRFGTGSPRSTRPAARRCSRIASRSASTRSTRRPTAMAGRASPRTASSSRLDQADRLARAVGLDMVEADGGRPSTIISAASPRRASSKPCARPRASSRRSSSTISRRARWRRRPNGCSKARAGCPSRCGCVDVDTCGTDAAGEAGAAARIPRNPEDEAAADAEEEQPHIVAAE